MLLGASSFSFEGHCIGESILGAPYLWKLPNHFKLAAALLAQGWNVSVRNETVFFAA